MAAIVRPKLVAMKVHNALGASSHERSTSKTNRGYKKRRVSPDITQLHKEDGN
jgi:hypothetical protein